MDPNGESLITNSQIKVVSSLVGSRVIIQYNNSIFCDASFIFLVWILHFSHTHYIHYKKKKKKRTGLQLRFKNAAVAPKNYNLINYFSTKYSILSIFFFLQNIHMKPLNGRIYDKGQLFANKNIKWNLHFLVLLELQWNYLQMFIIKTLTTVRLASQC